MERYVKQHRAYLQLLLDAENGLMRALTVPASAEEGPQDATRDALAFGPSAAVSVFNNSGLKNDKLARTKR